MARTELRTEHRISRSTSSHARRALQGPGLTIFLTPSIFCTSLRSVVHLFFSQGVGQFDQRGTLRVVYRGPGTRRFKAASSAGISPLGHQRSEEREESQRDSRTFGAVIDSANGDRPDPLDNIKDTLQGAHVWLGSSRRPALVACVEHTARLPNSQGAGPGVEGRGGGFDEQLFLIKPQSNVAWTFQGNPHRWLQARRSGIIGPQCDVPPRLRRVQ